MNAHEQEVELRHRLTVKEAAAIVGRSTAWVYDRLADGRMSSIRKGGRIYVSRVELDLQKLSERPVTDQNRACRRRCERALQLRAAFRVITNNSN